MPVLCLGSQLGGGWTCSNIIWCEHQVSPSTGLFPQSLVLRVSPKWTVDVFSSHFCQWDIITIVISLLDVPSNCSGFPFGLSSSCLHTASVKILTPNSVDAVYHLMWNNPHRLVCFNTWPPAGGAIGKVVEPSGDGCLEGVGHQR